MLSEDHDSCQTSIFCPLLYAVLLCKLSNNMFFLALEASCYKMYLYQADILVITTYQHE